MNGFSNMEYFFNKKSNSRDDLTKQNQANFKLVSKDNIEMNKQQLLLNSPMLKRSNRKDNFNTRSVWYDDDRPVLFNTGCTLRKASSFDSLLVEKENIQRYKITKDMISAPVGLRKIVGEWTNVKDKNNHSFPILEENESYGYKSSESVSMDSDNHSISSHREVDSETESNKTTNVNRSNSLKQTFYNDDIGSAEESICVREKKTPSVDKEKRKNIFHANSELVNNGGSRNELLYVENSFVVDEQGQVNVPSSNLGETKPDVISTEIEDNDDDKNDVQNKQTIIQPDSFRLDHDMFKSKDNTDYSSASVERIEKTRISAESFKTDESSSQTKEIPCSKHANELSPSPNTELNVIVDSTRAIDGVDNIDTNCSQRSEPNELNGNNALIEAIDVESGHNKSDLKNSTVFAVMNNSVLQIQVQDNNTAIVSANCNKVSSVINISKGVFPKEHHFDKKLNKDKSRDPVTKKVTSQKSKKKESKSNLSKMKGLSKSSDISSIFKEVEAAEVLRTLQSNKDEPLSRNIGPFPKTDDNFLDYGVQLREHKKDNFTRKSQTIGGDPRKLYKNQNFEVRGCVKLHLCADNREVKLKKNEFLQYTNSSLIRSDSNYCELLKSGVHLKSIKLTNKKEVELKDFYNQVYLVVFDSSKDAKLFMESDKISSYVGYEKSTITKTLLRLLGKRSSREVLEKKGIYQNEPIFGNTLRNIYVAEHGVPKFITKTMELIERPDNITSLGLYRTSGNLATIQKIRLEVDKGNLDILDNYAKDPDVLTGSLKLFFRELKEPLISCKTCDNLLGFTKNDMNYSKKDRDSIRTILSHIPEANSETLLALIKHLVKLVEYKEQNKMDSYNLAVCWGPTIIFSTDNVVTKDIVTQSAEATKLFDALLNFYINNPEELELRRKKQDAFDTNRNMIHRQDSKDSIHSSDSGHSSKNKSSSNLSVEAIDEVLRKSVDLIENHLDSEGVYRRNGSPEKVFKICKKMSKRKLVDLEKYKNDVYDLTDALKKYLQEGCDSLVAKETVEYVNRICDNTQWLEHNTRQRVITMISDLPKKDTFVFLLRHLIKLIKYESSHRVPKSEMILIWSRVLNYEMRVTDSEDKMINFLRILVDVFDETKHDVVSKPKGMSNGLLNDLKNKQKGKDRISKYDNVPEETDSNVKEAIITEEKTEDIEHTKL